MTQLDKPTIDEQSERPELARAAKLGAFSLVFTGVILIGVGGAFAYFAPGEHTYAVVAALIVGFVQIWIGFAGSKRARAFFGFGAPWWP